MLGLTLAFVSLIGFSAMVGAVGGGGLGDLGIRYGYQRFMPEMMVAVVVVLIVLVQAVQSLGDRLSRQLNKRMRVTRDILSKSLEPRKVTTECHSRNFGLAALLSLRRTSPGRSRRRRPSASAARPGRMHRSSRP